MSEIRKTIVAIIENKKGLKLITQKALAKEIGCKESTLCSMLKGDRPFRIESLEKICAALGVKLSDLENWNSELAVIRFTAANNDETAPPELMRARQKLSRLYKANRAVFDAAVAVIESGLKGNVRGATEDEIKKATG